MARLADNTQSDFQKLNLKELESMCRERSHQKFGTLLRNAVRKAQRWFAHQQPSDSIVLVFSDARER